MSSPKSPQGGINSRSALLSPGLEGRNELNSIDIHGEDDVETGLISNNSKTATGTKRKVMVIVTLNFFYTNSKFRAFLDFSIF
jgi:hypothetical protein